MKTQRNVFMRKLSILLVFAMLLSMVSITPASAASTYLEISDAAGLVALANDINSLPANSLGDYNVVLTADIDMSSIANWGGIGVPQSFIGITGTFDGNGHEIKGISLNNASAVGPKGGVFNLVQDFTIKNLKVSGSVTSTRFIGGIVGRQLGSLTMENCIADMNLTLSGGARNSVGGLIGQSGSGQTTGGTNVNIVNCAALGTFTSNTSTNPVGGLIGHIYSGFNVNITNSYVAASLNCPGGTTGALVANNATQTLALNNNWYLSGMSNGVVGIDDGTITANSSNSFTPGNLTASDLSSTAWKNMTGINVFNGFSYPVLNWQN